MLMRHGPKNYDRSSRGRCLSTTMLLYLLLGLPRIKGDDVAAYVDACPSPIPHCDMRGLPPAAISCV